MTMHANVAFQVKAETKYGESIAVVGNDSSLGSWDVSCPE